MPISRAIFDAVDPMWAQNFFDPTNSGILALSIACNIGPIRAWEGLQKRSSKSPKTPSWVVAHENFGHFKIAILSLLRLANPSFLLAKTVNQVELGRLRQ